MDVVERFISRAEHFGQMLNAMDKAGPEQVSAMSAAARNFAEAALLIAQARAVQRKECVGEWKQ